LFEKNLKFLYGEFLRIFIFKIVLKSRILKIPFETISQQLQFFYENVIISRTRRV